jgi:hypothetical protein
MDNNLPKLDSREMTRLKSEYPSLAHLEAGDTARWLTIRREDLLSKARDDRTGMNLSKTITMAGAIAGGLCYAVSPLGVAGAIVSGIGYAWAVAQDMNDSHIFAPLPFVRGDFFEFLQAMGDAEMREEYFSHQNEQADLMGHLEPFERKEYAMLAVHTHTLSDYLEQIEEGKRFYAYRWLLQWFVQLQGNVPGVEELHSHMRSVKVDSAINYQHVKALRSQQEQIAQITGIPGLSSPLQTVSLPQAQTVSLPTAQAASIPGLSKVESSTAQSANSQQSNETIKQTQAKAQKIIEKLETDGFEIREIMAGQIIGIAGTQRGGKGTLAGLCAVLNLAIDSTQTVEYFTSGVDVYPFKCRLHCALSYPNLDIQDADKQVARDLLAFLKKLANSEPYSQTGLILVIDECLTLLGQLEAKDRAWAIKYLLSNSAKTGACIIMVLHANNLTAIAGEETSGMAATFQESVHFIGCKAQSVPMPNNPMRSMNVASGEYFIADVKNFGKAIADGELGQVPGWLKKEIHPGSKQPDPVRSLLKFFPELEDCDRSSVILGGNVALSSESDDWDMDYTDEVVLQRDRTPVQVVEEVKDKVKNETQFDKDESYEDDERFISKATSIIVAYMNEKKMSNFERKDTRKLREIYKFRSKLVGRHLNISEMDRVINKLILDGYMEKNGDNFIFTLDED